MLKNESRKINQVKCMVCYFEQGKHVILGLKDVDTLEKHVRKHESCP
jgi:TATA-box binding protein (TBP) (component of TFIID and TFIIIB)